MRVQVPPGVTITEAIWPSNWALTGGLLHGDGTVEASAVTVEPGLPDGEPLVRFNIVGDGLGIVPVEVVLSGPQPGERDQIFVGPPEGPPPPAGTVALRIESGAEPEQLDVPQDEGFEIAVLALDGFSGYDQYSLTLTFDSSLQLDGSTTGTLLPDGTADAIIISPDVPNPDQNLLRIEGSGPGPAADDAGVLAIIRFIAIGEPGQEPLIQLQEATFGQDEAHVIREPILIRIDEPAPPPPEGPISLDFDLGNLDQGQRQVGGAVPGKIYTAQLHIAADGPPINGWSVTLDYDPQQVSFVEDSFLPSDFIDGLLPLVDASPGEVKVGGNTLGDDTGVGQGRGLLGQVQFRVTAAFTGDTQIIISEVGLNPIDGEPAVLPVQHIVRITQAPLEETLPGDFDENGIVEFADFFLFADAFQTTNATFDLNGDGIVNFPDFFLFSDSFGRDLQAKLLALAAQMLSLPTHDHLAATYPNPFNASTTIPFLVTEPGRVQVEIYDVAGQRVTQIVSGELPAGAHELTWDGRDAAGSRTASGVYIVRLVTPRVVRTAKILYAR